MNKLKNFKTPYDSFVGGWFIDKNICDDLINYFKTNIHLTEPGRIANKIINKDVKDSSDIGIEPFRYDFPFYNYVISLNDCLKNYIQRYNFANKQDIFGLRNIWNLQYYKPNGGFKAWHFERQTISSSRRVLTFMTYLNDVKDGGTEFFYQKLKTPAKKGLTLIWPSDFTHTHRGIISKTSEKYIATGWYEYLDNVPK